MSSIFSCMLERRNFGDIFSAQGLAGLDLHCSRNLGDDLLRRKPRGSSILVIWNQDPRKTLTLPELLVCEDNAEEDWAAWITTFGARMRPFSAFARLLPFTSFESAIRSEPSHGLSFLLWPATGLILGEVLAVSGLPDRALESISASACASTLSFAMFRAAAVYPEFDQWPALVRAWEISREITRQKPRPMDSFVVARICATVIEAAKLGHVNTLQSNDTSILLACRDLLRAPDSVPSTMHSVPGFSGTYERMLGSREERVVALVSFVDTLNRASGADEELAAFALGYLVSRVAPGTIQHATLLATVSQKLITAYLWYGFCAAVGGTESGSRHSLVQRPSLDLPGSARRVARDLARAEPILGPPTCDINLLELVVLSRTGGDPLTGFTTSTQGTVVIELIPSVSVVVNLHAKGAVETATRDYREKEILSQLGEQLGRLQQTYRRLVEGEPPVSKDKQGSLFPGKRRKR